MSLGGSRGPALVAGLVLACWPVWWAAGRLLDWLALPEADPLGRLGAVLLLLTLAERLLARGTRPH